MTAKHDPSVAVDDDLLGANNSKKAQLDERRFLVVSDHTCCTLSMIIKGTGGE
jgi:hypothetical protein